MVMDSASVVDRAQGHVSDRDKLLMEKIEKLETEHLSLKRQISEPKDTQPEDDKYEEEKSYRGVRSTTKRNCWMTPKRCSRVRGQAQEEAEATREGKATWRKRGRHEPQRGSAGT